jgi:2-polyprenyl-6-methoxyphenol hydroxylase-like FAD-dependent oxidoreductase
VAAAGQILPATAVAALRDATPLAEIAISRSTAAVWSRYDRKPRLPAGLLVIGDALCHLNPIYGQGMTMAALQALALRDCLRAGDATRAVYDPDPDAWMSASGQHHRGLVENSGGYPAIRIQPLTDNRLACLGYNRSTGRRAGFRVCRYDRKGDHRDAASTHAAL